MEIYFIHYILAAGFVQSLDIQVDELLVVWTSRKHCGEGRVPNPIRVWNTRGCVYFDTALFDGFANLVSPKVFDTKF